MYVQWTKEVGLVVQSGGARTPFKETKTGINCLAQSYYAQIAPFPIRVNDVKIDNANTHWNAKTELKIGSGQIPVLYSVQYDDARNL